MLITTQWKIKLTPSRLVEKNRFYSANQIGASTNFYDLIETAKANGLNGYGYLKWVFTKLTLAQVVDGIEVLLSWNIDKSKFVN